MDKTYKTSTTIEYLEGHGKKKTTTSDFTGVELAKTVFSIMKI